MKTRNIKRSFALLLLLGMFTGQAFAQQTMSSRTVPAPRATESVRTEVQAARLIAAEEAAGYDRRDWKTVRKTVLKGLYADDFATREASLQNIIYLATHYGDQIRFDRATTKLYRLYRFDRNEQVRIMALVALHAIGKESSMRALSTRVQVERPERVRRLTAAAVKSYYTD